MKIEIDHGKCNGDGNCVTACPVDLYELADGKGGKKSVIRKNAAKSVSKIGSVFVALSDECIGCRACEVQCPKGAIKISA